MATATTAAECWFLDVGQGCANIILLGGGRAIVIDSGPKGASVPLRLLRRHVQTIEALVISHNDADHDGGAARILQAFPRAIERIYYLTDRPVRQIRTYCVVKREREAGNLLRDPERIEAKDRPQRLYGHDTRDIEVAVIYPTFLDSQRAEEAGPRRPNTSSAIISLRCGPRRIVFSGDATIEAWTSVASRMGRQEPLSCDVLTVSHHGGRISTRRHGETEDSFEVRHANDVRRLYSAIIRPSVGVVSVGTSNRFGNAVHPLPATIHVLRELGIRVMCTQITPRCCEDLEAIRPGIIQPRWPSQSSHERRTTRSGRSKDVACAGTIVAEIRPDSVVVSAVEQHAQALAEAGRLGRAKPLCVD